MVATTAYQAPITWDAPSKPQSFSWVSLPIQSIFESGLRLEASVYATEAKQAETAIQSNQYGCVPIHELASIHHCPRFKRVFVQKSKFPIYQPSQIGELNPSPVAYISDKTLVDLNTLRVSEGQILMTCSGTVGNVTFVSKTLAGNIFSHDLLRIRSHDEHHAGYLYAYFKSAQGRTLIQSNNYGAVIQHVEPAHLLKLPIPDAPAILKTHIHHTVTESFSLRDESNSLIAQAQAKLQAALKLPAVEELNPPANGDNGLRWFSMNVADLNHRLEANYHNPLAQAITQHLHKHAAQVLALGDKKITQKIILAGRFKRVYVDEKQGVPFLGGKEILELDPRGEKYLSLKHHGERIADQLTLDENMILITCSGTIGKVNIVPKHWQGWAGSQHILRAIPASAEWAGYLYAWLSSEWALPLIRRQTYGAVVFEIDQYQLAGVSVPLLTDMALMQEINSLVLRANQLRYTAFTKEQEALRLFNEDVLGLPSA
ncbi:restriction endonuclease subunit S [Methylobacter sp.]|uniref:restriction endonuclease subunit S n=1 Tax=Methylobacter sp. TaxID=2051955 RepID=UPI002FDCA87D